MGIGLGQSIPNRHSIEDSLTARSVAALRAAGLPDAEVTFVGRDGTVLVKSTVDVDRAGRIVRAQRGVRVAVVRVAPAGPPAGTVPRPPTVTVTVDAGRVGITGTAPSTAARGALVDRLTAIFGGGAVEAQGLVVDPGVTDRGLAGLAGVAGALGTQAKAATVELRDGTITLTGAVPTRAVKDAAVRSAAGVLGPAAVIDRLVGAAPPAPSPQEIQAQLLALPPVTFQSGSATLTAQGDAVLAQAAAILASHPQVRLRIEGHTDTTGSPDANLALSLARAGAVRGALVARGIAADRLTVAGFGETRPKVPDTSPANQAINRRVEFVVQS